MDVSQLYAANQPPRPEAKSAEKRPENADARAARGDKGEEVELSIAERTRTELNTAIIESASEVSLSAGNEPLHLLYSAAIDKLNEVLGPELGEDAIQKAAERPEEFTPEATAERIVQFATSFYASYSEEHPELTEQERIEGFMDLISGAVDQGFGEARDILEGLKVLEGEVEEGVDKTYDLVQQGLQAFRDSLLGVESEEETEEKEAESDEDEKKEEKAEKSEEEG